MSTSEQKIVQYLNEAHGSELALVRVLQAQIAMTPSGSTATGWRPTSARRAATPSASSAALGELGQGNNPLQVGLGARPEPSSDRRWR